jgi:acetoacetyl-CoA synthetase
LIVCIEKKDGSFFMPLFVKMQEARLLLQEEKELIRQALKQTYSPRHVPDAIIEVPDIPYTISGKKMEIPVKRILSGTAPDKAADWQAIRNPEALRFFVDWKQVD